MLPSNAKNAIPYETKIGDTLWDLTERFYGNEDLWSHLGQANRISDPNGLGKVQLLLPRELEGTRIKLDRLDIPVHRFKLRSIPPRRISTLLFEVVLTLGGELWFIPTGRRTDRKASKDLLEHLVSDISVEIFPERLNAVVMCELTRLAQAQGIDWRMDDVRHGKSGLIFERRPREMFFRVDDWIIDGTFGCLGGTRTNQAGEVVSAASRMAEPAVDNYPAA